MLRLRTVISAGAHSGTTLTQGLIQASDATGDSMFHNFLRSVTMNSRDKRRVVAPPLLFICVSLILVQFISKSHDLQSSTAVNKIWIKQDETQNEIPADGFAACLLLKDNNYALSEWLAYHWMTLPLKYLVVAVDPTGTTSPKEILDLWRNAGMGMEIILWNDVDYNHWINENLDDLHKHRSRQKHYLEPFSIKGCHMILFLLKFSNPLLVRVSPLDLW